MDPQEYKQLVRPLNDKARKTAKLGNRTLVPHKVKPTGDVITQENFDAKVDISSLNLNELRFLDVFRKEGWNFDKSCEKVGITVDQGRKTYKKCLWFQQEEEIVKAKAKVPTANYILAKDLDNVEGAIELSDSDHKSLDRMAKITGSLKSSDSGGNTINIFNFPKMSPETEAAMREIADKAADIVDAEARPA